MIEIDQTAYSVQIPNCSDVIHDKGECVMAECFPVEKEASNEVDCIEAFNAGASPSWLLETIGNIAVVKTTDEMITLIDGGNAPNNEGETI